MKVPLSADKTRSEGITGLAAGTLVTTPDGDKKIEDIKAGDLILGGVGDSHTRFRKVGKTVAKLHRGPMLRIVTDLEQQFRVTPNHICFALSGSFDGNDDVIHLEAFETYNPNTDVSEHCYTFHDVGMMYKTNIDVAEEEILQLSLSNDGAKIERFAYFIDWTSFRFMFASDL
jgi:hypothetical protein